MGIHISHVPLVSRVLWVAEREANGGHQHHHALDHQPGQRFTKYLTVCRKVIFIYRKIDLRHGIKTC